MNNLGAQKVAAQDANGQCLMVEVDIAAFKVFDYPEGGALVDMKKHLRIAGFPLTKAEGLNAMFARETENGK